MHNIWRINCSLYCSRIRYTTVYIYYFKIVKFIPIFLFIPICSLLKIFGTNTKHVCWFILFSCILLESFFSFSQITPSFEEKDTKTTIPSGYYNFVNKVQKNLDTLEIWILLPSCMMKMWYANCQGRGFEGGYTL